MNTKEVIRQAELLSEEEKALVVDSLLRSLHHTKTDIDQKWAVLAQIRLDELRSGSVTPVPGEEAFARIWAGFNT